MLNEARRSNGNQKERLVQSTQKVSRAPARVPAPARCSPLKPMAGRGSGDSQRGRSLGLGGYPAEFFVF